VFTSTGKKTISVTMITRGSGLSGPNQFSAIGANAMIGIVLAPMPSGMIVVRANAQRAVPRPASVPRLTPTRGRRVLRHR
jgi:hypothetical protein